MSRVLQLVTRDTPGGVRVLTHMVGQGLAARGHVVTTLALRGEGGAILGVVTEIARGRYDAILSYQVAASLAGHAAGWLARVPVRAAHLTAIPSAMRPVWRWLDRLWGISGLHSRVVANSTATLASVHNYPSCYRQRLLLIPHGVLPLPRPVIGAWRDRLGIPATAPLLVSSGRLVEQKEHATAVTALAEMPGAHLAIAGDGPLRAVLLAQARALGLGDRVHLVGDLGRDQLASLFATSDVYVFPSIWESFGLAVVEAAMLGLPVVATDLPVLREVLAPVGGLARFHKPGDAAALAAAVRTILADYPAADVRAATAAAVTRVHAVYTMIEAYCRLLAGSS